MTTIAFTGHRPDKLGGYSTPNLIYNYITEKLRNLLIKLQPDKCITGMALGWDQWAAQACVDLQIPFIAAIPFVDQEKIWPQSSKDTYNKLLNLAAEKIIVCEGGYAAWKMQKRNEFMVDNADEIVACWDGTNGGTKNCVDYALSRDKKIHRINPSLYNKGTL